MTEMKQLVNELLAEAELPMPCLQRINEALLNRYKLAFGGYLTVYPKEVEIYYVNRNLKRPYVDANMHCELDPKTNEEIRVMQSGRFGKLYVHRKGLGGIDVCLSDSEDYALCCTIKAAEVNGVAYWSMLKVRNAILDAIALHEGLPVGKETRMQLADSINAKNALSVLSPREEVLDGYVYHLRRRSLRRRDKLATHPLRAFMDIWDKGLQMDNVQRVLLYMKAHPEENVLDVLRSNHFRYIPTEIKVRYNIDKKTKLYE